MSLDTMFNEVMAALGMNAGAATQVNKEQKGLADQNAQLMESVSGAALGASEQALQGSLKAQDNAIAVRQALGNDINDPNSVMAILVQDFREASLAARDQRAKVAQLQQTGLFDDPLQFIVNQVMLPDEVNAMNANQARADQAAQTIQNMQTLTSSSAAAQQATAQKMTQQSVTQAVEVQAAELQMKVNAAKSQSLEYDAQGIKILGEANSQLLSMAMQQHSMRLQDAAAARGAEMHRAQMGKLKEAEMEDQQYADIINLGLKSYQMAPVNLDTIKLMMKTPEQKAKLDKFFNQGMSVMSTGSPQVGTTPGEAILNTLEVGGLKGPENKPTRELLQGAVNQAAVEYQATNGKITKMTPQIQQALAAKVDDILFGPLDPKTGKRNTKQGMEYRAVLNADKEGSLYKAPTLPELARLPAVQSNILFQSVLKPAIEAGDTLSSPEHVYKLAVGAKAAGLINDKQLALGIADLYKAATAQVYVSRGMSRFGLPYRPSYMAEVTSVYSPDPSNKDRIDWAREESVYSYHVMAEMRKAYSSNYSASLAPKQQGFTNPLASHPIYGNGSK